MLVTVLSCCTAKPQTVFCLIQSFYREVVGSGTAGSGNLLSVEEVQLNGTVITPSGLTFTATCNDSATKREFVMSKSPDNKGSLIVSFYWRANKDYVVAIRNRSLQIEHKSRLHRHQEFIFKCATASCNPQRTLKNVLSHFYIKTDYVGRPMVGRNPDVTTWFKILSLDACDHWSKGY